VSDLAKMKKLVQDWRTEIKNDKDSFRSLYNFIFDYLRPDRATAIDKEEALLAWGMIEMGKRWKLWTKWEEHVKTTESIKSVTRDTWTMLLNFIDSVGDDIKNYDSMGSFFIITIQMMSKIIVFNCPIDTVPFLDTDCWPIAIDEFVEWLESHK
jgi:DCN1-like protein 1/2